MAASLSTRTVRHDRSDAEYLIREMGKGIDDILLDRHPRPTLNEVINAQVQSLARAISATGDPGLSVTATKNGLNTIVTEAIRNARYTSN